MKISIITVFPEIYDSFLKLSLVLRAIEKGIVKFNFVRFSDMCQPKERIDEPTCGPGVGMIIKPEVVQKAIEKCENLWGPGFKIFFSPQGQKLDQRFLKALGNKLLGTSFESLQETSNKTNDEKEPHLILVCSRYEGIDARVEKEYADLLLSIGDYILMGGDLPAQVLIESFLRLIPGVVGKMESVRKESFEGPYLDYPEYGLPVSWKNRDIPEVVRSGNHAAIEQWRQEKACEKTIKNRFDWFVSYDLIQKDIDFCKKFVPNHYVVLMHTQVMVNGKEGNTSLTSLDIHDIARSCATYGIENYFVVTAMQDQQKILKSFLDFWKSEQGKEYNYSRFQAVSSIMAAHDLKEVIDKIKQKEGKEPLIIATSAKEHKNLRIIDYFSQGMIFKQGRPVLFLFGTGQGLSDEILAKSDYLLMPVKGLADYNHLSVRSAVAVVLDRFLGLNPKKTYLDMLSLKKEK